MKKTNEVKEKTTGDAQNYMQHYNIDITLLSHYLISLSIHPEKVRRKDNKACKYETENAGVGIVGNKNASRTFTTTCGEQKSKTRS